jgi:phosphatidate phosphatase LPIN
LFCERAKSNHILSTICLYNIRPRHLIIQSTPNRLPKHVSAMQYVRSISGSVSKTWNSINPATLSGAIDVIVVEQEDGSLACSPFHVRFGKFSLLRPYEKKVEFRVNNAKQDYAMKLGEGGEAFFVFETSDNIPEAMQTSPLVSPASSPPLAAEGSNLSSLSEPDFLDLDTVTGKPRSTSFTKPAGSARRPSNLSTLSLFPSLET